MWPFGRKGVATRLTGVDEPTEVEIVAQIVSPNAARSPITGARAAIVHLEILHAGERFDTVVLGETTTVRDEEGVELSFVARRLRFRFAEGTRKAVPLARLPPELVPLLRREPDPGRLSYRECLLVEGDEVRVQAIVVPSLHASAQGYRSLPRIAFVARDDLAPVFIEVGRARS